MQTIEGAPAAIEALYAKIRRDPRHSGLILICDEPVAQRSYGDWSMAFREIARHEAAQIAGFRREQADISPADRDLARKLMHTFFHNAGLTRRG